MTWIVLCHIGEPGPDAVRVSERRRGPRLDQPRLQPASEVHEVTASAEPLAVAEWSYNRWTDELARYFFGDDESAHVATFCTDGPTLGELTGAPEQAAVASLRRAVASVVMPGYRFYRVGRLVGRWKDTGKVGPPPFLPLLALTVVAASVMQRESGVGTHNFYRRLREQLDPADQQAGMPGDFGDWVPWFWRQLADWLEIQLHGSHGVLVLQSEDTLDHNNYGKNIGHSLQQAVFRTADRRYLYRFFRSIGLDPEEDDVDPIELRRALAIWAGRHQPAAARLARLATDPSLESYSLELFARLAGTWTGQLVEVATGKPESTLRLRLMSRPFSLGLIASWDDRMPTQVQTVTPDGLVTLDAGPRWFRPMPLPLPVTTRILDEGLVLEADEITLRLDPRYLYALRFDETAGGWVDVDRVQFGELHHLLVHRDIRHETLSFCRVESPSALLDGSATAKLPQDWFLVRNVRLDRRPRARPPSELATLLRSGGGLRLRLVGGLKLPPFQRTYLVGGAPFLAFPEDLDYPLFELSSGSCTQRHEFVAAGTEFPLGSLHLAAGHYEVRFGPARIEFDLIDGIVETSGNGAGSVATDGVVGMRVGQSDRVPLTVPAPADHEHCILLGCRSSDVELLHKPTWMSDLVGGGGLSWTRVDAWPDFKPVWSLSRPAGTDLPYLAQSLAALPPDPVASEGSWSRLLLQAKLDPEVTSDDCIELWEMYQTAAREAR